MLPPQSDHQSQCLLHSLFLGCVSRGLLGFSHEDVINFDIGAHGPHSGRVYKCVILYTFELRPTSYATVCSPSVALTVHLGSRAVPLAEATYVSSGILRKVEQYRHYFGQQTNR
jgi:hypothetical protein